jgi:hypothetical protein
LSGDTTIEKKKFKVWRKKAKQQFSEKHLLIFSQQFHKPFDFGTKANFDSIFGNSKFWILPVTAVYVAFATSSLSSPSSQVF